MNNNIIKKGNDFMVEGEAHEQRYKTALTRLLSCPDLNHDSLEDETIAAIYNAHRVLGE